MSEERISLELLGTRVLTLTAEVRDLQHRFAALESRFSAMEARLGAMETRLGAMEARLGAMEQRFSVQEERMSAMLALVVRIAERLDRTPGPPSG
jgi:septal ring factor EnvC (AmiA/AmiB activator)